MKRPTTVGGRIVAPGDKSITHRALIFAALGTGRSLIEGPCRGADITSMMDVLGELGVRIASEGEVTTVHGVGLRGWRAPRAELDCGNSGTAARFLIGALAPTSFSSVITGDESLRRRPMRRVSGPLREMGGQFVEHAGDGLPLEVQGRPLRGGTIVIPTASAQVKTALILAGLIAGVPVRVAEPGSSRDHTERLLADLGIPLEFGEGQVAVSPTEEIPAFRLRVAGDPSSAAFLIAAALFADSGTLEIAKVCLNPTRSGFLRVLERMGADVSIVETDVVGGEPIGDVIVRPGDLNGVEVAADEVPSLIDEIPALAVLGARAVGTTTVRNVAELRVKESDRLGMLVSNLSALGAHVEAQDDDLVIRGSSSPLTGHVDTAGDHRLAMAFMALQVAKNVDITLSEVESVAVSYPTFLDDMRGVGLELRP